nr:hypothetical protein B11C_110184 [Bartonella sp. 1-1C]
MANPKIRPRLPHNKLLLSAINIASSQQKINITHLPMAQVNFFFKQLV